MGSSLRGNPILYRSDATQLGFVNAYRDSSNYSLAFIWNSVEYLTGKEEAITELALVRRARQFAKHVVGDVLMRVEETGDRLSTCTDVHTLSKLFQTCQGDRSS